MSLHSGGQCFLFHLIDRNLTKCGKLYDGVFSHSQLTILLKKYDGLGLFCSGKFVGLKRTICILGAHGPSFWGPMFLFFIKLIEILPNGVNFISFFIIIVLRSKKDHFYPHKSAKCYIFTK